VDLDQLVLAVLLVQVVLLVQLALVVQVVQVDSLLVQVVPRVALQVEHQAVLQVLALRVVVQELAVVVAVAELQELSVRADRVTRLSRESQRG
jgi:hypothetical protein